MTEGPRWARAPRPWRATLDGIVVADGEDTTLLGGSAAAVWDVLDRPLTEAEVVVACSVTYDLGAAAAVDALAALAEAGLCAPT